jgi:hypothetical protein
MNETKFQTVVNKVKKANFDTPIKVVTAKKMVDTLLQQETKGANFVQVFSQTIPSMRKTNNPYHSKVTKIKESNCQVNWFYENAVNNQRTRENVLANFEPSPRKWGSHIDNPYNGKSSKTIIDHTKKDGEYNQYIQMRTLKTVSVRYVWSDTEIDLTAEEVTELKTFFPPYRPSKQGIEKEVIVNDYKMSSIVMLKMDKTLYVLNG